MIYIKAMGHSPDPTENEIYVGTIPCIIPSDGVTDTYISCVTGDSGSSTEINYMYITLVVQKSRSITSSGNNYVKYTRAATPQLNAIFPTAAFGGQNVNLHGVHGISDIGDGLRSMGDITKLLLGNDLCSRFDVVQSAITGTTN